MTPKVLYDDYGRKYEYDFEEYVYESLISYKMEDVYYFLTPWEVEKRFSRRGRSKSNFKIIKQGKYECAAAALAMLLNEKLFTVKSIMGKVGWRNDSSGASDRIIIDAARILGKDLIKLEDGEITKNIGPCMLTVKSLNYPGSLHGIIWNGKQILDPNWGVPERKFWGSEWEPWEIMPINALLLLDFNLSQSERNQHDKLMIKKEKGKLNKILGVKNGNV